MLIEERTYDLVVGKVAQYVANYEAKGLPVSTRHGLRLVGYFRVEIGNLHQVVHYWMHESRGARQRARRPRDMDPDWLAYQQSASGMLLHQESRILKPTESSPPFSIVGTQRDTVSVEREAHQLPPSEISTFERAFQENGLPAMIRSGAQLVFEAKGVTGRVNEVIRLWYWESHAQREEVMARLCADAQWMQYLTAVEKLQMDTSVKLMAPMSLSPMR